MRKIVLLLTVLAIAAPSVADAKGKKKKRVRHHAPVAQVDPNANSGKLVGNGLTQFFVPVQSVTK